MKEDRIQVVHTTTNDILNFIKERNIEGISQYFSDEDTYIRKNAYLAIRKIWKSNSNLQAIIVELLKQLYTFPNEKVRQTVVNSAGVIGMNDFEIVQSIFDEGLFDSHHIVRNAVIGSVKKMSQKNPIPIIHWAQNYLHHPNKEIRREICHGIELRGRTHPQDILPLLKELEFDKSARVSNTLVHVIGQISYKKNCIQTVIAHINTWQNKELIHKALLEIIDVHDRYKDFSYLTTEEVKNYITQNAI